MTTIATEPKLRERSTLVIALVIFQVGAMIGKLMTYPELG